MDHYLAHKNNRKTQEATFKHFTNFAARSHWMNDVLRSVEPSAYLQVAMLLFNPTYYKDVLMGYITYDVKGNDTNTEDCQEMTGYNLWELGWLLSWPERSCQAGGNEGMLSLLALRKFSADIESNKRKRMEEDADKKAKSQAKKQHLEAREAAKRAKLRPKFD